MKKVILLVLAITSFSIANAQLGEGTNWLKIGVHGGVPVGDVSDVSNFALGFDLKYQFLNTESFAIGASTGYTNYFAEDGFEDFGIIPLAGLFRYYPTENFFLGADLGYGFLTEGDETGGFYYRPEVGYHNDSWNIFAYYQGLSVDNFSPASVGVGVNYNIIQGK